ncbi:hypothetical protein A3B32_01280 [Candidatus Uhrbacteria bacterium RIFCSPLOWO2_01_FULL_53_9]|uniref:HTH luxR-type domain-containing protein n=3 Tax=Candidatus Uhriibacteriota TaxID=1752732 RepID=A0A1F7UYN7_9BACT|nr:MAG: hypothetical protein A3C17_03810 [Candidatus Uhrbacteria bacterium RIFCSPHIGHO2_02_FULL_53_13]OGL82878.1 MAG: hypothetical protein A3B32_01280 [Candidatus Uhrbacteria bacterium RIFCSPLOWO2_01_FULL_53_9]OGL89980.1 MAG: hypothetical protein A3I45_02520 [Candidatus Uhrbacteria bacterium RIFCSPLOWO2_02_FULL_53_10]
MPVSIETQAKLNARRARVAQLLGLGLSEAQIDTALELNPGTTSNDVARLRHAGKLPEVAPQMSKSKRYARLFDRYVQDVI